MCGLVGVINMSENFRLDFDNYFKQALICDSVRGKHSTGVFFVDNKRKSYLHKKAINAIEFLQDIKVDQALAKPNKLMMGHNRYATKGSIDDHTAHPFQHGKITLCHNGTLNIHHNLTERKDFDVDSEAICYLLSVSNPVEALEKLNGAFALTWYDSEKGTFNIARNSERKLYFARVTDKLGEGAYLYASEYQMIYWLAARNDISIDKMEIIPEGKILTWDIHNRDAVGYTLTSFTPKPVTKYVDYYNYPGYNYNMGNRTTYYKPSDTSNSSYYSDKDDLFGSIVDVTFYQWAQYPNSEYGRLMGYFGNNMTVSIPGRTKKEAEDYLNEINPVKVKLSYYSPNEKLYNGSIVPSNVINFDKDGVIDMTQFVKEAEEESLSNSQKKREKSYCLNCDVEVSSFNRFVSSYSNSTYCKDCAEMYPEVIY